MFNRRKQKRSKAAPLITLEEFEHLPYADNFELPREEAKLRSVFEHERAGGSFDIRKVFASMGVNRKTINTVAHFPSYWELADIVENQYGGGTYNIHPAGSPRLFKTYVIDGPPKFKVDGPKREKSHLQKMIEDLEEAAVRSLCELAHEDPRIGRAIAAAAFKKSFGVELPAELGWEDQLFQEGVEGNSEYQDALIKARLRERGVNFPEQQDGIERLITEAEQTQRLRDALGVGRKGFAGILQDLIPVLPVLLQALRGAQGIATAGTPISPALDTPVETQGPAAPIEQPVEPIAAPAPVEPMVAYRAQQEIKPAETAQSPPHLLPDIQPGDKGTGVPALSWVDWAELETGAHGDPEEFIRGVYRAGYEEHSLYHRQLARLFQDNEPDAISAELSQLAKTLVVASGEDYEVAVMVLKYLEESEEGRLWLAQAHSVAELTQGLIGHPALGTVESTENRNTNNYGIDEEDFSGPILI